ncbi:MAG: OPT/YSL family transporter, partial [Pseudobutyrivibrio sp.]|nr:OPT/YSL family transporter [Pseudobutyrivibrio sp.]
IAVAVEVLGISSLPVAIGLYLPLELSAAIMVGGIIRHFADKRNGEASDEAGKGILFCSGLIAGEGLVGVLLAFVAAFGAAEAIDLSGIFGESTVVPTALAIIGFVAIIISVFYVAIGKKNEK